MIDEAELQRALGLRSSYLTKRVLSLFDRNKDGVIQRAEFVAPKQVHLLRGADARFA